METRYSEKLSWQSHENEKEERLKEKLSEYTRRSGKKERKSSVLVNRTGSKRKQNVVQPTHNTHKPGRTDLYKPNQSLCVLYICKTPPNPPSSENRNDNEMK